MPLTLDTYRLLGRSGLRVSPLALGAATFGTEWGWGAEQDEARKLFDLYVERGGNFIDTASTYTEGSSERLLGAFAHGRRESLVLATKYSTLRHPGDPNSGGGHRKNLFASVETSLRRLRTDYVDLLYLHLWDAVTPVEEVLRGLDDLVCQGKVLYVAISNAPAWQVARMQTVADLRGWSSFVDAVEPEAESGFDLEGAKLGAGEVAGWLGTHAGAAPVGVAVTDDVRHWPAVTPLGARAAAVDRDQLAGPSAGLHRPGRGRSGAPSRPAAFAC